MILENPATVKLLGALVEVGQRGATRELLQQKTGLGKTSFYRILKPLLGRGIVREEGSLYRIPLDRAYNFLFKQLHDIGKVEEFTPLSRDRVFSVIDHAKAYLQSHLLALWLVGSAAHQTMTEASDLDFLAVIDKEVEYLPNLDFEVHFITMTEEEFRERWLEKNDFVLTALRHGLLLEDKGFAREFYLQPLPVRLQGQEFHQDADELEEQKERLMLSIQSKASKEAAQALSHYAISIARRMLRIYNVLPAGKPDLMRAAELLWGQEFRRQLEQAVHGTNFDTKQWATEILQCCHQIEDVYRRFSSHLAQLQKFADLTSSSGIRHEEMVANALSELSDGQLKARTDTDGVLTWKSRNYVVEVKSLQGPCTLAPLHQLTRHMTSLSAHEKGRLEGLLIVNPYRSVPLLERRKPFDKDLLKLASERGIKVRSTTDLLRAMNRGIMEPRNRASVFEDFLQAESLSNVG